MIFSSKTFISGKGGRGSRGGLKVRVVVVFGRRKEGFFSSAAEGMGVDERSHSFPPPFYFREKKVEEICSVYTCV